MSYEERAQQRPITGPYKAFALEVRRLIGWTEDSPYPYLSTREAARKIGSNHVTVNNITQGDKPSEQTVTKIARAFKVDEDNLRRLSGYIDPSEISLEPPDRPPHLNLEVPIQWLSEISTNPETKDFAVKTWIEWLKFISLPDVPSDTTQKAFNVFATNVTVDINANPVSILLYQVWKLAKSYAEMEIVQQKWRAKRPALTPGIIFQINTSAMHLCRSCALAILGWYTDEISPVPEVPGPELAVKELLIYDISVDRTEELRNSVPAELFRLFDFCFILLDLMVWDHAAGQSATLLRNKWTECLANETPESKALGFMIVGYFRFVHEVKMDSLADASTEMSPLALYLSETVWDILVKLEPKYSGRIVYKWETEGKIES